MSTNLPFILTAVFLLYITDYENQDLSKTQIFEEQILFMKQGFLFLTHSSISLPMSPRCTSELTLDVKRQSKQELLSLEGCGDQLPHEMRSRSPQSFTSALPSLTTQQTHIKESPRWHSGVSGRPELYCRQWDEPVHQRGFIFRQLTRGFCLFWI